MATEEDSPFSKEAMDGFWNREEQGKRVIPEELESKEGLDRMMARHPYEAEVEQPDPSVHQDNKAVPLKTVPLTIYIGGLRRIVGTATISGNEIKAYINSGDGRDLEEMIVSGLVDRTVLSFHMSPPAEPDISHLKEFTEKPMYQDKGPGINVLEEFGHEWVRNFQSIGDPVAGIENIDILKPPTT